MSWSKFARAAAHGDNNQEIGIRGQEPISQLNTNALKPRVLLPLKLESSSGVGNPSSEAISAFSKRQIAMVHNYKVKADFWLPSWVREHINRGSSKEELVREIIDRVRKDPHQNNLEQAQWILNELGRSAENVPTIRKFITRDFLKEIIDKGYSKRS